MTTIANLGPAIAQLRAERAWSQEALAASAGISARTVQRVEEGKSAAVETVAAIARALECGVENLKNMALCLEAYPTMIRMPRARIGGDVVAAIRNAQASMRTIHTEDRAMRTAALALIAAASEWADVLDDIIADHQAEDSLDQLLDDLHATGGKLFVGRLPVASEYQDSKGHPIILDTVLFVVYPDNAPSIIVENGSEFALVGTAETDDIVRKFE